MTRHSLKAYGIALALAGLIAAAGWAQQPKAATPPLPADFSQVLPQSFYAVSIRPDDHSTGQQFNSGLSRMMLAGPLDQIILAGLNLRPEQLVGLPGWARSRRFVVQAEIDPSTVRALRAALKKLPPAELPAAVAELTRQKQRLFRAMLNTRFHFVAHDEVRRLSVYDLVAARSGLRATPAQTSAGRYRVSMTDSTALFLGVTMDQVATALSSKLRRAVINQTGLSGQYDVKLKNIVPLAVAANSDPQGETLFAALQHQAGLELKPAKGPVTVLVVDRIEAPTAN